MTNSDDVKGSGRSAWLAHVKEVQKKEGLTYHQALTVASKTWKKSNNSEVKESNISSSNEKVEIRRESIPEENVPGGKERLSKPARKPAKPRMSKAQMMNMEMELLRLRADLAEAREELRKSKEN
jgi:hypothetical protein